MIQHIEAKLIVAKYIRTADANPENLLAKAQQIENKLAADQFEETTNKHNAEYVRRFYHIRDLIHLPNGEIQQGGKHVDIDVNGVNVRFDPALTVTRTTKTNKVRCGAIMLRYQKGKALPDLTAAYQSSAILGLLKTLHADDGIEPEGAMCVTLDAFTGVTHPAPGNAVYLFKEMQAACLSIAERWNAIGPPPKAVL